jgi:hypothetical protein
VLYTGTWLVLATVAIMLTLYLLGLYWAKRQGLLDGSEAAKYAMLEEDGADRGDER